MKIIMPASVNAILNLLHAKGFEAYAVGGCVRDTILNREPNDWDITTSARPEQVKALFDHTVDTGLKHGTVTVLIGSHAHEVTTYRIDGSYSDGRHPDSVEFTPLLSEDLKRRDFTINAMAYNKEEGLVDLFGGMHDLQIGIIRCVGDAEERFREDALRILRALRFAAQLGFTIDSGTLEAVRKLSPTLEKISAERINVELTKLLKSPRPEYIRYCYETGITAVVLPELDICMKTPQNTPYHRYSVGEHIIRSLSYVEADPVLRWTMLLHDIAKPDCRTTDLNGVDHFKGHAMMGEKKAKQILRRLKFDNETIRQAGILIRHHDDRPEATAINMRRLLSELGPDMTKKMFQVQWADLEAKSDYRKEQAAERIRKSCELVDLILLRGDCYNLKMLALNGQDLIAHGVKPGSQIGQILKMLLDQVLEDPEKNKKDILLKIVGF